MTPHQTLAVAVRLFAVVIALYAARELLSYLIAFGERDKAFAPAVVVGILLLFGAVAAVLWFFPKSIARGLLASSNDAPAAPSAPDAWLGVGSALIGLWLTASAFAILARNLMLLWVFWAEAMDRSGLLGGLVYGAAELVVGLALIFGATGIRNFLVWARTAGLPKSPD
jgi:hypothetical protein